MARDEDRSVEDVPLLAELDQLLGPVPVEEREPEDPFADTGVAEVSSWVDRNAAKRDATRETYAHVIVDEAQDLSPDAVARSRRLRSAGVLDRGRRPGAVRVAGPGGVAGWRWSSRSATSGDTGYELRTNYRNSAEIYEYASQFAKRAMPDVELPEAVRKTGFPPEEFSDLDAAVRAALDAVQGTVGSHAAPSPRTTGCPHASAPSGETEPRLVVLTDLDAKGLEYDAAVVVDPDAIAGESPAGLRTLYVALTRATQRLYVVSPG